MALFNKPNNDFMERRALAEANRNTRGGGGSGGKGLGAILAFLLLICIAGYVGYLITNNNNSTAPTSNWEDVNPN